VLHLATHGFALPDRRPGGLSSACQTGVGQVATGDATWSLARAFQKAGARVVVTSLWRVPDQSTRLLMEDFYGAFLKDDAPAEALRHAQTAAMSAGMAPRHWAAFTCWGLGANAQLKKSSRFFRRWPDVGPMADGGHRGKGKHDE
jgi:CHAT domain